MMAFRSPSIQHTCPTCSKALLRQSAESSRPMHRLKPRFGASIGEEGKKSPLQHHLDQERPPMRKPGLERTGQLLSRLGAPSLDTQPFGEAHPVEIGVAEAQHVEGLWARILRADARELVAQDGVG